MSKARREEKKFLKDKELEAQFFHGDACLPSPEDVRDYTPDTIALAAAPLPEEYRTEGKVRILNQGVVGSCVSHAISTAMQYGEYKAGFKSTHDFSRGMIYANRKDTDYQGEGMYPRQALKSVNHDGDCLYDTFPYNNSYPIVSRLFEAKKEECLADAEPFKIINYFRIYDQDDVKRAITSQGAVIISISIYSGFGKNVKLPEKGEKSKGSHCMCCVGWNKNGWIVANSWSSIWGDKGYCYIPYDYPINEWWGITVNSSVPQPKKENIFVRILKAVKNCFKRIFKIK